MKITDGYKAAVRELFDSLPHGGMAEVARRADENQQYITKVKEFSVGNSVDWTRHDRIIKITKEYIAELEAAQIKREKDLRDFLDRFADFKRENKESLNIQAQA